MNKGKIEEVENFALNLVSRNFYNCYSNNLEIQKLNNLYAFQNNLIYNNLYPIQNIPNSYNQFLELGNMPNISGLNGRLNFQTFQQIPNLTNCTTTTNLGGSFTNIFNGHNNEIILNQSNNMNLSQVKTCCSKPENIAVNQVKYKEFFHLDFFKILI